MYGTSFALVCLQQFYMTIIFCDNFIFACIYNYFVLFRFLKTLRNKHISTSMLVQKLGKRTVVTRHYFVGWGWVRVCVLEGG